MLLFSKMIQDFANRSVDLCQVGQGGHSLSLCVNCNLNGYSFKRESTWQL